MDEEPITLRTHHLLCLSHAAATGSQHPTLTPVLELIRNSPDRPVRVVVGPDDICTPCPHWNGTECGRAEGMSQKNRRKDKEFLKVLDLSEGQTVRVREIYDLISRRITRRHLRRICPTCRPDECYEATRDPSMIFG